MLRGADKDLKDKKGKTPIALIEEIEAEDDNDERLKADLR